MKEQGFTLIELSIVLVIIGLIVGGVLVGQNLITASEVRAQITQIEKYNSAANTFLGKYGYLPGDIPNPVAGQNGFVQRGLYAGEGDGNGILQGVSADGPGSNYGFNVGAGETLMFWVDLSTIGLIDGGFNTASPNVVMSGGNVSITGLNLYFPQAKIGKGNYVTVWTANNVNLNYYTISAATGISGAELVATPNIPVAQAYKIDAKIDDGWPGTGRVIAMYYGSGTHGWANAQGSDSTTSCFNNATTAGTYSLSINNGAETTCALTFQFQ